MAIHSPGFLAKKRRRVRAKLLVATLILLVLLGAASYVSHRKEFLIANVVVSGNTVTSDAEVEAVVLEKLEGKHFWLFPKANELLFPRGEIRHALYQNIPRISSVEFETIEPDMLEVAVVERSPFALYCENITDVKNPEECYFLDEDGLVFSKAPSFSGEVFFIYTRKEPFIEPLGMIYLPEGDFRALSALVLKADSLGVDPAAFEADEAAREYRVVLGNGGRIVWKYGEKFDTVAENLESFLLNEEVAEREGFMEDILEIDLSFKNKVFYRFQEDE